MTNKRLFRTRGLQTKPSTLFQWAKETSFLGFFWTKIFAKNTLFNVRHAFKNYFVVVCLNLNLYNPILSCCCCFGVILTVNVNIKIHCWICFNRQTVICSRRMQQQGAKIRRLNPLKIYVQLNSSRACREFLDQCEWPSAHQRPLLRWDWGWLGRDHHL